MRDKNKFPKQHYTQHILFMFTKVEDTPLLIECIGKIGSKQFLNNS